ncbi:hypothetical protein CASFOL_016704 [Castilleja foliolosa]|uniref:Uncharacterized protein n=1 Tax=Castilleja foliolosa TaxID=1961234 RepID=A0ABD3DAS9_9LAMI
MTSSIMVGYKSSFLYMKPYSRSQALSSNPISRLSVSNFDDEIVFPSNKTRAQSNIITKRNHFTVYANSVPGNPSPSGPPSSHPMGWIIGIVVSLVLPFFTNKWGPLWVLRNRIMNAVQSVEDIVEAVEKVAEKVDEIAEDIGDDLPQGKLKDLVHLVENMAEKTAKTADCIDNVIDKVQEVEDQVEKRIVDQSQAKKTQKAPEEEQDN